MRFLIAPHGISNGARSLARGIGGKITRGNKVYKSDVTLINWGRSDLQIKGRPQRVLNKPEAIARATNKARCLQVLRDSQVMCVDFTTNQSTARKWLEEKRVIYGRKVLSGSAGEGIVIMQDVKDLISCPLYTLGVLQAHEYRVHVVNNKVIDITKKRRRSDTQTSDYIKNLENGWVYCRDNIDIPECIIKSSLHAITALGLDFGAVDILYRKGIPYILEVNTAPGLEGTTLDKYINEFRKFKTFGENYV